MELLKDLDAFFITNPTNIRYLTGFVGVEDRDAYCLLTSKQIYLFTNSLYIEQAKKLPKIELIEISREDPISTELSRLCGQLNINKLGFEEVNLTVAELAKLKSVLDGVSLIPTKNRIEEIRQIKRPEEIINIKKACAITDASFDFIITKLKPGVTESEIAWEIETFLRNNHASSAFSPVVAFGKNSSQPHHQSDATVLTNNNLILLDFGAKYNGYCADMTRVVFIGKPKDEWIRAYDTVSEAQKIALDLLNSGTRNGAVIDCAAKEIIVEAGLPPYPHNLGHNIGLDAHEGPRLSVKKDEQLLAGMVFSIEPGVYLPGRYGIRIEDLVRLTDTGIQVLTRSPKAMITL